MDSVLTCGYGAIMDPVVEGTFQTADAYWTVEVVRYGVKQRWYRVSHAHTQVADRVPLATVQRILGDSIATLAPVDAGEASAG